MGRKVEQVRFYQKKESRPGDARNQPSSINRSQLVSGSAFSGKYPIVQLGIQTLPGVKFYLNKGTTPIIIGNTGIYDLELDGVTQITHLCFEAASVDMINNNEDSYLIVDFIYETED